MNCIKCPIEEECKASKMILNSVLVGGIRMPTVVVPPDGTDCPLKRAVEVVNRQLDKINSLGINK